MDLIKSLKNEDEALLLLSAMGFSMSDWPTILRLGGTEKLLSSDLIKPLLNMLLINSRESLDNFFAHDGFIFSHLSHSSKLFQCAKSPLAYMGRFNKKLLDEELMISVVGSRSASAYGLNQAKKLSSALAEQNITVVSGGAMGIDQAAHMASLNAGGCTIAISGVACDFNHLDPCAKLFIKTSEQALVIYPFGPFLPQGKFMFVERNRYVAAIAKALVVVEGRQGSGTLHTANYAKKENVPLFAIPGSVENPLAFAPNFLLWQGHAKAVVDFQQFAASWVVKPAKSAKNIKIVPKKLTVEKPLPALLQVIKAHESSLGFDELLKITGKTYAQLQQELFEHELSGLIKKRGAQFVLTGD